MVNFFLALLLAALALQDPPGRHPAPGEITAMLAVPARTELILVWADGNVSCVESTSGGELWSTWLPPPASRGGRMAVTPGQTPTLVCLYEDEDRLFMLVFDVAAAHQPRRIRLGTLGAGMWRIVATEEGHVCIHDNGNDKLYDCSIDGAVRCEMDVETCLIGAVLVPNSVPLLVSFHSDRSVIAARLCGKRQWTKRSEFLQPEARIGSTIVAVAHSERFVLGLRPEDGEEVWRYPYPESDEFVTMLPDGKLVFTSRSGLKLVRRNSDSEPERLTVSDYDGDVDVVAVGNGREVACMSALGLQEGNLLRRHSSTVTLFSVSDGKQVHAWTPVKPVHPSSQVAGDWPRIYRKK